MKTLKQGDGFSRQSPELRPEVKVFQQGLVKAGYPVDTDGLFGRGTEAELKRFQADKGLAATGIVDSDTWKALETGGEILRGFRGDAAWVHAREGYAGKAYWPGGESGVTLDPGIDLGYAASSLVEKLYGPLFSREQLSAIESVAGIKGEAAKAALSANPVVQSIRVSREQSDTIFPYAADPYWEKISGRFKTLADDDTFPPVQTVMLSLAYNRGPYNKGLEVLRQPIEEKNWAEVANVVGAMQQDHPLEGIRKRRRMEAELIRSHLG
ncbi:peptidoglycan-binding protein [Desulfoluna spongiiphila]|uniref:Peptidoglycan-binding (PGRP) domain of peptidoglycan hydrolases-containing protein n=1 Tax=Desulfoluna spongiiphila TaxID=419481 RepID=A0A1G5DLB0_9BACT|nr:peptidoglycan-binding protein [Desulfoluna spongiiphila]SCY15434.1 Peptidoglycan-binding (PGRP) domain of peptidoglycan hydrolases-containing protein [Desulfoluna spongiiphila]VVS95069.1 bacterial toxin homologue of phage lysozyme c-terminal [Desulfoluna spongiiphila]